MDERSKRIIDTAIELATRDGYAAVRLREVAARAKVALGTVYKRFDSKEQILVAAMMQEGERLLTDFGAVPGETPAERAIGFFEVATSHFTRRPKLGKAILRAIAAGEGMTERVASLHALTTAMLVAAIGGHPPTEHREWGGDVDADVREIAQILQQVWFAALVGWAGDAFDADEVVEQVARAPRRML